MKIRSITYFLEPGNPIEESRIVHYLRAEIRAGHRGRLLRAQH